MPLAFADNTATQSLIEKLNTPKTFSSDFNQTVVDAEGNVLQHNNGKMQFDKNRALFYWDVESPEHQTMWYKRDTQYDQFTFLDYDLEQATIRKNPLNKKTSLKKDPSLLPVMLLVGNPAEALQSFSVDYLNHQYVLKLIEQDKSDDSLLMQVTLHFDAKDVLDEITYQMSLGQKTIITFTHAKINSLIDQTRFRQTLPAGTDIVDASK